MLEAEQYHEISGGTAREIAATAEAAIRHGRLGTGDALPTVRALAQALGISPATVNSGYRTLRQRGLVIADGRRGTRVAPRPALRIIQPARPAPLLPGHRDLTFGLADPELLPAIGPALARLDIEKLGRESSDADLLELGAAAFAADGVSAAAMAVVGGALDGIERVLQAHLRPGDRVILEDPAYPPIRDIVLALGLLPVPVPVDDRGLVPERFAAGLETGVEAAILVPRAQNPFGAALDHERAAELRELLVPHPDVLLVEDDHASLVAGAPFVSLVSADRSRWAVVRSVSKTLHPDLRLALIAGDEHHRRAGRGTAGARATLGQPHPSGDGRSDHARSDVHRDRGTRPRDLRAAASRADRRAGRARGTGARSVRPERVGAGA